MFPISYQYSSLKNPFKEIPNEQFEQNIYHDKIQL